MSVSRIRGGGLVSPVLGRAIIVRYRKKYGGRTIVYHRPTIRLSEILAQWFLEYFGRTRIVYVTLDEKEGCLKIYRLEDAQRKGLVDVFIVGRSITATPKEKNPLYEYIKKLLEQYRAEE